MEDIHKLSLYITYHPSRFKKATYAIPASWNMVKTRFEIGMTISLPVKTVRNLRDEFDPLIVHYPGWLQRPINLSWVKVPEDLDVKSVGPVVKDMLTSLIQKTGANWISLYFFSGKELASYAYGTTLTSIYL